MRKVVKIVVFGFLVSIITTLSVASVALAESEDSPGPKYMSGPAPSSGEDSSPPVSPGPAPNSGDGIPDGPGW